VQLQRAKEQGRGRQARSPRHIPWRGWRDILYRTFVGITAHRLLALAASAVFFDILAVFPGIAALVSIYGLFASGAQIRHDLVLLATIVPSGAIDILGDQIDRISAKSGGNLSVTFLASLAILERECRHQGDVRRPERDLRRGRETQLRASQCDLVVVHRWLSGVPARRARCRTPSVMAAPRSSLSNAAHRLRQRTVDDETGEEVPKEGRARGYEVGKGSYITLDESEFAAIQVESSRVIVIDNFCARNEVDELYIRDPYFIVPEGEIGVQALAVIREALRNMKMVGLGRVVLTTREHVLMIEPRDKGLMASTLR